MALSDSDDVDPGRDSLQLHMPQNLYTIHVPNMKNIDPLTVLQEYMLSFSSPKSKTLSKEDAAASRGSGITILFFENLEKILEQHVGDILEVLTKLLGLKQRLRDLVTEISKHQKGFPFSRRLEFQELTTLLAHLMAIHSDLERHNTVSKALEFEAYQLDAETLKVCQKMDNINKAIQDSEDHVAELQTRVVRFKGSITD